LGVSEAEESDWLLLAFSLPAQAAYLRVKIWRRLQSVGAVSYRNSLSLLPSNESTLEDFEWILRAVREGGGDGAIFDARLLEGTSDETLRSLFNKAREEDYRVLSEELRGLAAEAGRNRPDAIDADLSGDLARIRKRLIAIEQIDFFNANGRDSAGALLAKLEARVAPVPQVTVMNNEEQNTPLRARTWVTRAHVQVDRMASAWLIKRFIDPDATFSFTTERHYEPKRGELRFDMYDAEYTHDADRCTFEVLLDLVEKKDAGLRAIAEMVHDLDIKDHKYEREETAGVKQLLAGITASCERDEDRLARSAALFNDLHRSFLGGRQ
jgi:hypothetical protein